MSSNRKTNSHLCEGLEHGDDTAKTLNSIIKIWEEQK